MVATVIATGLVAAGPVLSAQESPFMPKVGPIVANTPGEVLEFAGVSTIGKRTDLVIHDKAAKITHWIGLGETVDGISVLRYDAEREQVVLRAGGVEKTLALRKSSGPANAPAPIAVTPAASGAPAPESAALPAPSPPSSNAATTSAPAAVPRVARTVQERQEEEARMLVSDLLEIGMAQRKAYEEAQKRGRASAVNAAPATTDGPPAQNDG